MFISFIMFGYFPHFLFYTFKHILIDEYVIELEIKINLNLFRF